METNDCTSIAVVDINNKMPDDNGKLYPTTNHRNSNNYNQTDIDYDATVNVTIWDIIDVCYSIDNLVADSPASALSQPLSSVSKILLPLIPQKSTWWCALLWTSHHHYDCGCSQQRANVSNQTKRSSALYFSKNMNRLDNQNIGSNDGSSGDARNEIIIIIIIPDQPKKSTLNIAGETRASQSSSNCCLDFVTSIHHTCHSQNYQHSNISMKMLMMITSSFSSSMHLVGSSHHHQYNYNKFNNNHHHNHHLPCPHYYHHYSKPHSDITSLNCVHNLQSPPSERLDQMVPSGQHYHYQQQQHQHQNHYYYSNNNNTIGGNVKLKSGNKKLNKMNSTRTNLSSFVIWWWLYSLATIILSNQFILPVISQEYYQPTQSSLWPTRMNEYNIGDQPGKHFLTESFAGGRINGNWTLKNYHLKTNYTIINDIIINEQSSLTIEPAVQLLFAPGIGITVLGTLMAKVSKNENFHSCKPAYLNPCK